MSALPDQLLTERLLLRPWHSDDAKALHPILVANSEHLSPWIPPRIATPAVVPLLAERLGGFAAEFAADREWRFGMFTLDEQRLLGEVDLFPRSASGRVQLSDADRAEIGYWIRADETGRGFVTEAVRAILGVAGRIERFAHVEIRCEAQNAASSAIPRRLGFQLTATIDEPPEAPELPTAPNAPNAPSTQLQIWILNLRTSD